MSWYKETVFYELYLRGFRDSDGDGHGDLRGAIEKLDYIQSLGVGCIWILPHYPSPLKDDGYDVADYRNIHPDYGTLEDFKAFVDAAHARGLKVVTDLVMNHTSDQHPWFQAARQDRNSPYHDYYVWSDTGTEYKDIRLVFPDFEPSNWTYDEMAGRYFWHRFFRTQPDLNFDNPAVHDEMLDIVRFWLDLGVDGFRLDAVIYLYEREGTDGAGLPETHAFIKKVRHLLDSEYPDRILLAEANDWPKNLMAYFGNDDECHMAFNFPIMPRLYISLMTGKKWALRSILEQTPKPPANAQWLNFLRNHDELSLEMVTDEEAAELYEAFAPDPEMRINNGIRRRLGALIDGNLAKYTLLNGLLLALPGTPILYYGDEIGMGDNITLPDRHGVRTPMQWNNSRNGGFTTAVSPYSPVNDDPKFGVHKVNVASQETNKNSFLNRTRHLITTRQASPALRSGQFQIVSTGNSSVFAWRRFTAEQDIFCMFNLNGEPEHVQFNLGLRKDLLGIHQIKTTQFEVTLEPYAVHWFEKKLES